MRETKAVVNHNPFMQECMSQFLFLIKLIKQMIFQNEFGRFQRSYPQRHSEETQTNKQTKETAVKFFNF